ncbi:unnamed protein product [Nippostrongylus brasiliensis]|uniref:Uncharacterized protein n=1 Tax=Nippostrongylus brasiliensis TaxID=27835 RepID=A0A0N4XGB0_NIPBR|nr:unnamed protein product [Nippostrongylus brasiliensis]
MCAQEILNCENTTGNSIGLGEVTADARGSLFVKHRRSLGNATISHVRSIFYICLGNVDTVLWLSSTTKHEIMENANSSASQENSRINDTRAST